MKKILFIGLLVTGIGLTVQASESEEERELAGAPRRYGRCYNCRIFWHQAATMDKARNPCGHKTYSSRLENNV